MNIFFWQNCISPHQVPYIRRIIEDKRVDKVYLIAPKVDSDERKAMGWKSDLFLDQLDMEVYVTPDEKEVDRLMRIEPEKSIHLFSGIRGDHDVFQYFLHSLRFNFKRGFIIEPPYTYNKPLWAHYIRFFLQDRQFIKDFDYVFAIGEDAVTYYNNWSRKWKVVPFVYCVESPKILPYTPIDKSTLSVAYVGSLSKRKEVITLLKAVSLLPKSAHISLDIYGDGDQRPHLEEFAKNIDSNTKVTFHGRVDMKEVTNLMQKHDVFVLPSAYDGWGAVINEALMCGLYSICSSRCGARLLLKDPKIGKVFKRGNAEELCQILQTCYQDMEQIRSGREQRQKWSQCISGKVVAKYMIDNLTEKALIKQPWN